MLRMMSKQRSGFVIKMDESGKEAHHSESDGYVSDAYGCGVSLIETKNTQSWNDGRESRPTISAMGKSYETKSYCDFHFFVRLAHSFGNRRDGSGIWKPTTIR